jgi:hypothetical protein
MNLANPSASRSRLKGASQRPRLAPAQDSTIDSIARIAYSQKPRFGHFH